MIITIDGPAGTGKTTVARKVAETLGISYFDTGAMYRAVTWGLQKKGISLEDQEKVEQFLRHFDFQIIINPEGNKRYYLEGMDITEEIRDPQINGQVSTVAAKSYVREALGTIQRTYGKKQSAVFEGRDLGSVIFPKAYLKVFLDASPQVRGKRRFEEEVKKGHYKDTDKEALERITKEICNRDALDSKREIAPLLCPKDAIRIDTSTLSIEEVVKKIVKTHKKRMKRLLPSAVYASKMKLFYRCILFFTWLNAKLFYRHKVYGLEHTFHEGVILAPNHASYLDPPLVAISWPQEIHFLAKQELFRPFLLGPLIRALNSHPVHADVNDISVFKTILEILKEKQNVLLFPEGSRTLDGKFQEIKPGVAMLALRAKALIIPIYIEGTYKIWKRGAPFPKFWGKTACVFGSPIDPEEITRKLAMEEGEGTNKKKTNRAIGEAIEQAFHRLKAWYHEGAEGIPP